MPSAGRADPGNAEWQRDLSVSHDKIGDVRRAQGDLKGALRPMAGLAIGERLAAQDPANTQWQRDLSVSHNKIGDVLVSAQGDLKGAFAAYEQSLAIRERLAAQDATNAVWKDDLSYSKERVKELQKLIAGKSKGKRR